MKTALLVWVALEFLIFVLLVSLFGLGWTILLGLATTFLGFFLLGRSSRATLAEVKRAGLSDGEGINVVILGPARILGAILLILPGFLTDLIGLLLLLPHFGDFASGTLRQRYSPNRSDTIDLDASEWRSERPESSALHHDMSRRS